MNPQNKLLVIEDETAIRDGLTDVFIYHGYHVDSAATGTDGLEMAIRGQYDLILLDIMLPGINGFDICDQIRQRDRSQPIIMLTAKNSEEDIILGLKSGADDYVSKPFSIAELLLRIQAVLRRTTSETENVATLQLSNGIQIDTQNLTGTADTGVLVFTRREIDILCYLAANTSRPVSREELLAQVWGYATDLKIETRTVDIHIAKLRRKIESNPKEPVGLITVRGAGYRLLVEQ